MLLDLSARERHAAIKAVLLALAAMDSVPERRRPTIDRENVANLLGRLQVSQQESDLYNRAANWILREIEDVRAADHARPELPDAVAQKAAPHG